MGQWCGASFVQVAVDENWTDGDATHRAMSMMMWKPESSVDESIKAACDGLTRWARYRNEASQARSVEEEETGVRD